MSFVPIALGLSQGNAFSSGRVLKTYLGGTTTATPMYTDSTGGTSSATVTFDSAGLPTISSTVVFPHTDTTVGLVRYRLYADAATAATNTGQLYEWDNIQSFSTSQSVAVVSLQQETFVGSALTGSNTIITLTSFTYVPGANAVGVYVNGDRQFLTANYTETSGTVITLNSAVKDNDNVDIYLTDITTNSTTPSASTTYTRTGTSAIPTNLDSILDDKYTCAKSMFGVTGDGTTDDTATLQNALNAGGRVIISDGTYLLKSQLNITVANTILEFESRAAILKYGPTNTGNLFSIKTTGVRIIGGTFDGDEQDVAVGSATEDGALVSAIADSEFKIIDCGFQDVTGVGTTLGKQALLNISNDGVVFEILDCDFKNCYILDDGGSTQDAKFISFKGNTITTPTRGRIVGGSMIGVGTTVTSGTTTDKDGKCIRGYYNETTSNEQEFDIEITGVYATEFDEAFIKVSGMRGFNVHDNHLVGIFTNPWDAVVNQSQYAFRSVITDGTEGSSTLIHDNKVRGKFFRLFELGNSVAAFNNDIEVDNLSASVYLDVIYELSGSNIKVDGNRYKLATADGIFSFTDTLSDSSVSNEDYTFTTTGDEGGGLGRRLIMAVGDITNVRFNSLLFDLTVGSTVSATDILFMNGTLSDADITELEFNDVTVKSDFMFFYLPRVTDTASQIEGVKYHNFNLHYQGTVALLNQPNYTSMSTFPKDFVFEDFTIRYKALTASTTNKPFALDECMRTTIRNMTIEDIASNGNTVGFMAQFRGSGGTDALNLDIDGLTFKNIDSSQSRCVDIQTNNIARIENVTFIESIAATLNGIQFTLCDDLVVGNISANDSALSSWASLVDVNTGDNIVVGKVNCRGTKASFGTATNTVDNS